MRSIEEILNDGPFPKGEARELLDLCERHVRAGQAAWLIQCLKPLERELQAAVDAAENQLQAADRAVKAVEAEVQAAASARAVAGGDPPLSAVERHLQVSREKAAQQQARSYALTRTNEALAQLKRLQDIVAALRSESPPSPADVQEVVRRVLSAPARLVGGR